MALWPHTVELAGVSIPLAGVLADVQIHHGRTDVADEPTATTCQLTFADVELAFVEAFDVGQTLRLTVRDGTGPILPRFTGEISDARLEGDDLTVIAAARLATFHRYPVGLVNWPEETWSARVTRIFTEAGIAAELELHVDPLFNPLLAARDTESAGPSTLGDYLTFLAPTVGALVADRMDGRVLVQAIGSRVLELAVELDPADVAYAPAWTEELPRGNVITVRYKGDQSESVTVSEPASIALYGEREATIDTPIRDESAALYRANQYLSRAAFAHWNVPAAPLLRGLEVTLGAPLILHGLPAASPFDPWTPIVEGWSETITAGDPDELGTWTMELALSDPLLSGVALPWSAIPATATYLWNTVDPATDWTEALTLESLEV